MSKNAVIILVACHKPGKVYHDDIYTPIHVGRAISKYTKEMANMIGDDTGDNISVKNPNYCELTALYWAWKNLDCEYLGLCHYRRYFTTKITKENFNTLLENKYDLMCPEPIYSRMTLAERIEKWSCLEDFHIFLYTLKEQTPEYYDSAIKTLKSCKHIPYNMFFMKKHDFDNYMKWLFKILSSFENRIRYSNYSRGKRVIGYYAEIMFAIYINHNSLCVKHTKISDMIGDKIKKNGIRAYIHKLYFLLYNKIFPSHIDINIPAILIGLKNDGIDVNEIK